jgi:uncharacterized protein (TIGR03118 family)
MLNRRGRTVSLLSALSLALLPTLTGCSRGSGNSVTYVYQRTNLTADTSSYVDSAGSSKVVDSSLINPGGITASPSGPLWIASTGTGNVLVYGQGGNNQVPAIPVTLADGKTTAHPTDVAYNGTTDFVITDGTNSAPAQYLFVTYDGSISGWNSAVNGGAPVVEVDVSAGKQSEFTGATLGAVGTTNYLFVADYGKAVISIFDSTFKPLRTFTDTSIPSSYAPVGIRNFNSQLYVTYAQKSASGTPAAGAGLGYIDVFSTSGALLRRLVSNGPLNAPDGLALAPNKNQFGPYSNDLLVANSGDGTINVFDPNGGGFITQLKDNGSTNPITVQNLHGLQFGNGGQGGTVGQLFFTAGVNNQNGGLFGTIDVKTKQ